MCCLFGLIDTRLRFTGKQKSKMLHALATVSEVRGTDATGIAYHVGEQLCIYKRPIPGHKLKFYMRDDTRVGMGHTRMTTQGKASKNRNNHPLLASGDNRHSGSGEKRQFWSTENSHLQFE